MNRSGPADDMIGKCPRCASPKPHLHPAIQHGGEVQVCIDPYHRQITTENTRSKILLNGLNPIETP